MMRDEDDNDEDDDGDDDVPNGCVMMVCNKWGS